MNNVVLSTRNIDDLINDIANEVINRIAEHQAVPNNPKQETEEQLLTRNEVLRFLRITSATLWRYEKKEKFSRMVFRVNVITKRLK